MHPDDMMGPGSLNVTMICPNNQGTVDFILNIAYAPGCIKVNTWIQLVMVRLPACMYREEVTTAINLEELLAALN